MGEAPGKVLVKVLMMLSTVHIALMQSMQKLCLQKVKVLRVA